MRWFPMVRPISYSRTKSEKLAALVSPPCLNLVLYYGVPARGPGRDEIPCPRQTEGGRHTSLFDAVHAILPNDGEVGVIAQLQTWGDNLAYDPHLHLLVVGALKGEMWTPVVLSEVKLKERLADHLREMSRDSQIAAVSRHPDSRTPGG